MNPRPQHRAEAAAAWALGLLAVAVQAMALATRYFQAGLDSDYLYPQRFVADLLGGRYPMSGWSISSSAYVFPDFTVSALWYVLTGRSPVLPYYVVTSFLALALAAGWALARAGAGTWRGRIAGVALVNLLLAFRSQGDHARWLWWLGTATFHGGAVTLGLVQFALWAGPGDQGPGRRRTLLAGALMLLGGISDTLFMTQFVLPLGAALWVSSGRGWLRSPRGRAFAACLGVTVAGSLLSRLGASLLGWGSLPGVFRYAPTPSAVASSGARMAADLRGLVTTQAPGFIVLFVACTAAALLLGIRGRGRSLGNPALRGQASWFAGLSLLSTLLMPVLSAYWHNAQHGRYLLPCLVLPSWWLLARLLPGESEPIRLVGTGRAALALLASVFSILAARSSAGVRTGEWEWPYPGNVAEMDRVLGGSSPRHGLADYWHAHLIETLSRGGLFMNQLSPDGSVQFWDNNAYHHFVPGRDGLLHSPRYDFVVVDGLDGGAVLARFGPPAERRLVGGMSVWVYGGDASARMSAEVDRQVRAFLRGRPGEDRLAPAGAP